MPASKLVLGIAAYGHGFRVNSTAAFTTTTTTSTSTSTGSGSLNMYPSFNKTDLFQGSSWDSDPPVDVCGNAQSPGGTYPFWSLITEAGMLTEAGEPAQNIVSGWDNCSQTVCVPKGYYSL